MDNLSSASNTVYTNGAEAVPYRDMAGKDILAVLKEHSGIRLDIGAGFNPQPGFVSMDIRAETNPAIVWDFNMHPWPIPDGFVLTAIASHVLEHIPGVAVTSTGTKFPFLEFMDEVWRCLRIGGDFMIAVPHGRSNGYLQDPTHVNAMNEGRWSYFDPGLVDAQGNSRSLWGIYQPKPWKLKHLSFDPRANMEVVMTKRAIDDMSPTKVSYGR